MNVEEASQERLRSICLDLPETSETDSWGHPNFRAGKRTFAAFEWIRGRPSIALRLGADEAGAFLLRHKEAFVTPYGKGKWVSVWADEQPDWSYLRDVIELAYRSVALKRMIVALEKRSPGTAAEDTS